MWCANANNDMAKTINTKLKCMLSLWFFLDDSLGSVDCFGLEPAVGGLVDGVGEGAGDGTVEDFWPAITKFVVTGILSSIELAPCVTIPDSSFFDPSNANLENEDPL